MVIVLTNVAVADEPAQDNAELLALLDRELNRLADKYRVPVVLCELVHERVRQVKASEGCSKVQASVSIEERKVRLNVIQAD